MGSEDMVLYALWKVAYTVSYQTNGATVGTAPVDRNYYVEGQAVTVPGNTGNMIIAGYSFDGWNTAADGSGTTYTGGQTFTTGSEDLVLYAQWAPGFVTTWKTDNITMNSSDDDQITISTDSNETYDYSVDWGDGATDIGVTGPITHTYDSPGTYTVMISGRFPRIYMNPNGEYAYSTGDVGKLLTIENWGNIAWTNMHSAFRGCSRIVINAKDLPDLSGVTDMSYMFYNAYNFNSDISSWDVSNVTNMSYMFRAATTFNGDLSSWDVSSVTSMDSMFAYTNSFNGDLSSWDVSNVTDMENMFYRAVSFSNHDLSVWNVSSVTDHAYFSYGWGTGNTEPVWP
jgi:surface protein